VAECLSTSSEHPEPVPLPTGSEDAGTSHDLSEVWRADLEYRRSLRGRAHRAKQWLITLVILGLIALIVTAFVLHNKTSIEHSLGVGSPAWEQGYTYGEKAVGSVASDPLSLDVTLDCHGTYPAAWELWVSAGVPGMTKHMSKSQQRQWIPQFTQGCLQGVRDQWSADMDG